MALSAGLRSALAGKRRGLSRHLAKAAFTATGEPAQQQPGLPKAAYDIKKRNNVSLIGRVIKLPEIQDSGSSYSARFRLAVDNVSKAQNATFTDIYTIRCINETARAVADSLTSTNMYVLVDGRLAVTYRSREETFPDISDVVVFANSVYEVESPSGEQAPPIGDPAAADPQPAARRTSDQRRQQWQELLNNGFESGEWVDVRMNKEGNSRKPDFKKNTSPPDGSFPPALWLDSCPQDIYEELQSKGIVEGKPQAQPQAQPQEHITEESQADPPF